MKFSYSKIEAYCNEMDGISNEIKNTLDNINGCITRLEKNGCWQGNGYDYYIKKLKEIAKNFENVNESINNNVNYLKQAADNYKTIDKKIVSYVNDLFS